MDGWLSLAFNILALVAGALAGCFMDHRNAPGTVLALSLTAGGAWLLSAAFRLSQTIKDTSTVGSSGIDNQDACSFK